MIALRKFELFEAATSLLYPPVCALCGSKTEAGEYLCEQCEAKAMRIVAPFCQQCSEPFEGAITNAFTCANWWRVGSMRRLTMNVFAGVHLTSSCPSHCIQLAGGNADSIKRGCLL